MTRKNSAESPNVSRADFTIVTTYSQSCEYAFLEPALEQKRFNPKDFGEQLNSAPLLSMETSNRLFSMCKLHEVFGLIEHRRDAFGQIKTLRM